MTDFGFIRGIIDKRSYLDADDLNGPGLRSYKKISPIPSVNFALFKIYTYSLSEAAEERKTFVSQLPKTIEELGPLAGSYIEPLLNSIHSEDCKEVQKELAFQFPLIISSITQSPVLNKLSLKSYLEVTRSLVLSPDIEVSQTMASSIPSILPYLHQSKVNSEIIGISISLVLEKSREEKTVLALGLISSIVKEIGSELTEKYFYREIIELSQDSSVNVSKAMIELLAELFKLPKSRQIKAKVIAVFVKYLESENWNIRKHSISFFPRIYKNCDKDLQDLIQPLFVKALKDKSKWVKEQAANTCCCVIIYSKIQITDSIIKGFFKVPDSGYYHAAFYFPGVLLTLGPNYWPDLKKLLHKLADSDIRTKSCVVKSIHEIAKILGAEIAGKDLVELYEKLLHSVDTKTLAYENLPNFLRELFPEARDKYKSFIKTWAKDKNWRVRQIVSHRICEYIGVYDYNSMYIDIWPLALELCEDQNFTVRTTAAKEVAKLAMYLLSKNSDWKRHIEMCVKRFALGGMNSRIIFLLIVKHFAGSNFASDFKEEVLSLSQDKVKNVRIMCAEAINYNKNLEVVWEQAKKCLENDDDLDVKFEFGKIIRAYDNAGFVTPPILRRTHMIDVGGIVKFSHSAAPKFAKIEDFEDISDLIS